MSPSRRPSRYVIRRCPPVAAADGCRKDKCMTSVMSQDSSVQSVGSSQRANALADRLEQGARALAAFASALTEAEWQTRVPKDGRKVGVIVHHVASVYPLEI